jgi:hypothetical protein
MITYKILNNLAPNGEYFELVINSDNSCFCKYYPLFGEIVDQDKKHITILWKHTHVSLTKKYLIQNDTLIGCGPTIPTDTKPPNNFDAKTYQSLNPDLYNLNIHELQNHYILHGIEENRKYKPETNLKQQPTFSPVFINHDISLTGAPIFLYDLVTYLLDNNVIQNPIIIEPYPNNLFDNYNFSKMYHYNNIDLLTQILENIDPVFIYSNSLNLYYFNANKFKKYWFKTYFHFHETIEYINSSILKDIKKEKLLVVAQKIKNSLIQADNKDITLFPPFITQEKIYKIQNLKENFIDSNGINTNKVTIGMSGSLCDRKNFKLFYQIAKECPQYEFIWVGGLDWVESFKRIYGETPENLANLHHIPYTNNPYPYYKLFDYFFLTSKNDPCPIVVLENMLLNNRIIVTNNIYYQHNTKTLKNNYTILDSKNDNETINLFKNLSLTKYIKDNAGEKYICKNFNKPKLFKNTNKPNHYILFNYYDNNSSSIYDINYFKNLINNFNYYNKQEYKVLINVNVDNNFQQLSKNKKNFYYSKYKSIFKNVLNFENLSVEHNQTWDTSGLLKLIKNVFDNHSYDNNTNVAYLHNKSNIYWRKELNKIFYHNYTNLNYDTVVSDLFYGECEPLDNNRVLMEKYSIIKDISNKKFNYIQGTIFLTKLFFLQELYDHNKYFTDSLTNLSTINSYWINLMLDNKIFNQYYEFYKNNKYNKPIDFESQNIVSKNLATNYIQLYHKFNKKGIPDLHFEHCLERYIGYLISHNRKVHTV